MENIFVEFLPPWVETGIQPAFYDKESGSVLQQTARMYARVNMLIRMFNKLSKETKETVENYIEEFTQLHDYVHDYFDNLDVQEEINNKLDSLVNDGTISRLLMETDFIDNTEVYFHTLFVKSKFTGDMSGMQGGCVLPNNSIIQFNGSGNVVHYGADGSVINSNTINDIGHCNSCCYDSEKEKVYIAGAGTTIGAYKIFEVDPNTLTLTDTIDCSDKNFPQPPLGIIYDKNEDCYIFGNWWGSSSNYLWKTDKEFNVILEKEITINNVLSTSNVGLFGDYIGINNMYTHQMFLFNKNDLSYYKTISISELVSDTWVITEQEWWDTRSDGTIILGFLASGSNTSDSNTGHGTYIYSYLNPRINYNECVISNSFSPKEEFYYVDHTYTNSNRNGSQSKPFNNVYEAINSSLRRTGCTGKVTIRFSNGSDTIFNPSFRMDKHYVLWYPNGTFDFFGSIGVDYGCYVHINRPVTLQLLDNKTDPFGLGEADIHCYGNLIINGNLDTNDHSSPIIRGYDNANFKASFSTCGLDIDDYNGNIEQLSNYLATDPNSQIKNFAGTYNTNIFTRQIKGIKASIVLNDNNEYVVPPYSKSIIVIPKITVTTTGNVNTPIEMSMVWNPNTWISNVYVDLDGNTHTISVGTNGKVNLSSSGGTAVINRVKMISM